MTSETDDGLTVGMFTKHPSLAVATAQRLARFMRTEFDPKSETSWATADKLWRAALLSRDAERSAPEQTEISKERAQS